MLDDTLVVFTSDHGFNTGHHGLWGKGNGAWPLNMVETSLKVPLIFRWPAGGVAKGATKLDISESDIRLYAPAPPRGGRDREYRLNAKLARRVLSDQAKAKWKSKAEQLVVTIPTLAGH